MENKADLKSKPFAANQDELIKAGENFASSNNPEKALDCYSRALDCLVAEAKAYAERSEPQTMDAVFGGGKVSEIFLQKFNQYLKKDRIASIVSNNMAVIFARMGDKASAKSFFEQAIDLTPDGVVYDDPHIGLQTLGSI